MCETEAFEIDHRQDVLNVKISPQIYKYITGIMQFLNNAPSNNRSRDATKQNTIKQRFEADFDFSNNQGKKLHKVSSFRLIEGLLTENRKFECGQEPFITGVCKTRAFYNKSLL